MKSIRRIRRAIGSLSSYEARFAAGEEPQYFDKEFMRLWFIKNSDPYADAKLPDAPADLVQELSRRYIQMYEQIAGEKFQYGATPVLPRIERNLQILRRLKAIAAKPAGACRAARWAFPSVPEFRTCPQSGARPSIDRNPMRCLRGGRAHR